MRKLLHHVIGTKIEIKRIQKKKLDKILNSNVNGPNYTDGTSVTKTKELEEEVTSVFKKT